MSVEGIDAVLRDWETTGAVDHVRDTIAGSVVPAVGQSRHMMDDWELGETAMRWTPDADTFLAEHTPPGAHGHGSDQGVYGEASVVGIPHRGRTAAQWRAAVTRVRENPPALAESAPPLSPTTIYEYMAYLRRVRGLDRPRPHAYLPLD